MLPEKLDTKDNTALFKRILEDKILERINKADSFGNFKSVESVPPGRSINCLMFALQYYEDKNLKFTNHEWDFLIKNSNLLHVDSHGMDALMQVAICQSPRREILNLTAAQWDYLIKNSDLTRTHGNNSSLMYILQYNKEHKTKISKDTFNYLIDNSNLLQKDKIYSLSVLGLLVKSWPNQINKVFTKVISSPEFNIDDYRNDQQYNEIRNKIIEIETNITKDKINKSIHNNKNKKSFKI